MGTDITNLAGSTARSSDAETFANPIQPIKVDGADSLRRSRLLQERERRRRQMERHAHFQDSDESDDFNDDNGLDVMV